jgi:hypothetical protein
MANMGNEKSAPQKAPNPQPQDNRPFGERRPPAGDSQRYDKHGGNLEHDGKRARSQQPPNESRQHRQGERLPRTPHRSGQEYETGETPETGLGGAGNAGVDPSKAWARKGTPAEHEHLTEEIENTRDPKAETRQGGGSSEDRGVVRSRHEHRVPIEERDMPGQRGLPPEAVEESGGRNRNS